MKKLISTLAVMIAFAPITSNAHKIENEFDCTLNTGHTMKEVFALVDEWMERSKKLGFSKEQYDAQIIVPIFSHDTATNPERVKWRGKFKDFATEGIVLQAFWESGVENKIRTVMNCRSAEQWLIIKGEQ